MHDEDVIVRIHRDADDVPEHPVVRQRFGPQRVDLEPRRLHGMRARIGAERRLRREERAEC
jgi:hypothetical protein